MQVFRYTVKYVDENYELHTGQGLIFEEGFTEAMTTICDYYDEKNIDTVTLDYLSDNGSILELPSELIDDIEKEVF